MNFYLKTISYIQKYIMDYDQMYISEYNINYIMLIIFQKYKCQKSQTTKHEFRLLPFQLRNPKKLN